MNLLFCIHRSYSMYLVKVHTVSSTFIIEVIYLDLFSHQTDLFCWMAACAWVISVSWTKNVHH